MPAGMRLPFPAEAKFERFVERFWLPKDGMTQVHFAVYAGGENNRRLAQTLSMSLPPATKRGEPVIIEVHIDSNKVMSFRAYLATYPNAPLELKLDNPIAMRMLSPVQRSALEERKRISEKRRVDSHYHPSENELINLANLERLAGESLRGLEILQRLFERMKLRGQSFSANSGCSGKSRATFQLARGYTHMVDRKNLNKGTRMKFMYRSVAVLFFSSGLILQSTVRAATNEASSAQSPGVGSATGTNAEHCVERFHKHMQKIAQALDLTEAQKSQIKPILQTGRSQIKALRADTSLTHEQKVAQIKAIRAEIRAQIKAILTPEQLEKWKTLRHHHNSQQSTTPSTSTPPQ